MAVNKVVFGAVSIMDISDSTVTKDKLFVGEKAYGADGEEVHGEFTIDEELSEQDSLIDQIQTALEGKVSGRLDTSDATATAADMAEGVTAYVNGEKVTGNVTTVASGGQASTQKNTTAVWTTGNNGLIIKSTGTVEKDTLMRAGSSFSVEVPNTQFGSASPSHVLAGKTFTSRNGVNLEGAIPTHTADDVTVSGATVTVPYGFYNTAVTKSVETAELPELTNPASASDIASGMEVIGADGEVITGTVEVNNETYYGEIVSNMGTIFVVGYKTPKDILYRKDTNIALALTASEDFGTATQDQVLSGATFTSAAGLKKPGTFSLDTELSTQDNLIAQIQTALQGKTAEPPAYSEEWTFTMENGSTVTKEVFVGWTSQA